MLNEIDGILQEIDKFKGSVQNTENFSKQLHKDLAIIENYTATLADYKRLLLSELEKNAQSGQKHIEAARQTLLLELGKITRSAEEAKQSILSELGKNEQAEKKLLNDTKDELLARLEKDREAEQKEAEAAASLLGSAIKSACTEIQEANESLAKGLERLVNRKINLLLILSAVNTIGILLLFFLR